MTEQGPRPVENRGENFNPTRRQRSAEVLPMRREPQELYARAVGSGLGTINGRTPRFDARCNVCSLVPNLQQERTVREANDQGELQDRIAPAMTQQEAIDAEADMVQMIYSAHDVNTVRRHLKQWYGYDVSQRSMQNHISNHIPDPHLAYLTRVKETAREGLSPTLLTDLLETQLMVLYKGRDMMASGEIRPKSVGDVLKVVNGLYMFAQIQREVEQEDMRDEFMKALARSLDQVFGDDNPYRNELLDTLWQELAKGEEG